MAATTNYASDIAGIVMEFYEKQALESRVFKNGLLKHATRADIPKGSGRIAHFHRWQKYPLAEMVTDGNDPTHPIAANVDEIDVEMVIMASYINIPTDGDEIRFDSLVRNSYPEFETQVNRSANYAAVLGIDGGSGAGSSAASAKPVCCGGNSSFNAANVLYAGGKASFSDLKPGDIITNKDISKAAGLLQQQGAPPPYICLTNPWHEVDLLTNDEGFRTLLSNGGSLSNLKEGQLPNWAGCKMDMEDEPMREVLGGTEGTYSTTGDVFTTYVMSPKAIGVTQLMGKTGIKPRFKVQDISLTDCLMTIGYRMWFAFYVLNSNWIYRIKAPVADSSVPYVQS